MVSHRYTWHIMMSKRHFPRLGGHIESAVSGKNISATSQCHFMFSSLRKSLHPVTAVWIQYADWNISKSPFNGLPEHGLSDTAGNVGQEFLPVISSTCHLLMVVLNCYSRETLVVCILICRLQFLNLSYTNCTASVYKPKMVAWREQSFVRLDNSQDLAGSHKWQFAGFNWCYHQWL